jgi:hypothetical protein
MPGMNSSQMESMMRDAVNADHSVEMTATDCSPALNSELPEFLVRNEGSFDGSLLAARKINSALVWNLETEASASATSALLLVEGRPPRISLSDPLFFILRI